MSEIVADEGPRRRPSRGRRLPKGRRSGPPPATAERADEPLHLAELVLDLVADEVMQRLKRRLRSRQGGIGAAAIGPRLRVRRRREADGAVGVDAKPPVVERRKPLRRPNGPAKADRSA